jgi:hypothetical protein
MAEKTKSLAQRLLAVRASVPAIHKDGTNPHQRFSYASSSGVLTAVREAMDREGVVLIPSVVLAEKSDRLTKAGNSEILTELRMSYRIINADDPADMYELGWYGQGLDTGERGVGKALTYAEKYLILKLFNVPTDDADPDAEDRQPTTPKAAPAPQSGRLVPPPAQAASTSEENPNAMLDKQRKMIWAIISKKAPQDATPEEKRALIEHAARRACGCDIKAVDKRGASILIEWLDKATPADFAAGEAEKEEVPF